MRNGASVAIPRQRSKDLVVRVHGDETLVLDRRTGTVHCLPVEVSRVWEACTGGSSLAEIASAAGVDEHIAAEAVDQLMQLELLDGRLCCNRRRFLQRSAVIGAGAAAAPAIQSVIASPAMAAGSPIILISGFSCSGVHGIVKSPITVRMAGFTPGQYIISTTIGPAPSPSIIAGSSYTVTPFMATLPTARLNVLPGNPPQSYRGIVPGNNPTPITIVVTDPTTNAVVSTFTGTVGPCPCSLEFCTVEDTVDFNVTAACTGSPASQVALTYTVTGGLPGVNYYYTATSLSTPTVTYSNHKAADATGYWTNTVNFGSANRFNDDDIVYVTLRSGSATAPVIRTVPVEVGPCPPIPENLQFNVTAVCTGSPASTVQLTYTLTGGVPALNYYYDAASTRAPIATYSNHHQADANGNFSVSANFGSSNQFNASDTVYVTLRQASATGTIVETVPVTVGPCPPTPPNMAFTVTPACTGGAHNQATLTYTVTGGVPNFDYYWTAVSTSTPTVTYSNHHTTDKTAGNFAVTANFGGTGRFATADTVTVTLRMASATGVIVKTVQVTVGPCPPTSDAGGPSPSGSPAAPTDSPPAPTDSPPAPTGSPTA